MSSKSCAHCRHALAQVFLWPVAAIVLVAPFAVLAGFNPSRFTLNIYFG